MPEGEAKTAFYNARRAELMQFINPAKQYSLKLKPFQSKYAACNAYSAYGFEPVCIR
jgi:hypothetical protein